MQMTPSDVNLRFEFSVDLGAVRPRRKRRQAPGQKLPRIRYVLVLGHQLEELANGNPPRKYAEVAKAAAMTTSRQAQIVAMTRLAPDIQAEILAMNDETLAQIPERMMRPMLQEADWERQRQRWRGLLAQAHGDGRLAS